MKLTNIKIGDVVLVDDGIAYMALVKDKQPYELRVEPIAGHFNPKPVKASDVKEHWQKVRK